MKAERHLQGAIRDVSDPLVVMRRVVDQALGLIPDADGAVVELAHDGYLTYVCAGGSLSGHIGTRLRLSESLSGLAIRTGETLYCEDSASDSRVDHAACRRVDAVSMVCVPLRRGPEAIGVLKVSSSRPRAFSCAQVGVLATLADFMSAAIGAVSDIAHSAESVLNGVPMGSGTGPVQAVVAEEGNEHQIEAFVANVLQPGMATDLTAQRRIEQVIADRDFRLVCQPIVDLSGGELIGAEALARFPGPPEQPPDVWFNEAHRAGLGVALELAAFASALSLINEIPSCAYLAINMGPTTLANAELLQLLESVAADRVVIELTEHMRIDDYPQFRKVIANAREQGARLAIDDTGAGFASLSHIVNLAPDLIKLDRQFTTGIDLDPVRRALARALVSFAHDTGADVIAEGIETPDELQTIRQLGIRYGQGYLIQRPAPAASLQERFRHVVECLTATGRR